MRNKRKINLIINKELIRKSKLTTVQYLLLAYLREDKNFIYNNTDKTILESLEELGYIRMIDDDIIVNSKTEDLFLSDISKAKELLAFYNELKIKHLKNNRKTASNKYVTKFRVLLESEEENIEYIKIILEYTFNTWKIDSFWKPHLNDLETIIKKFEMMANRYETNKNEVEIKQSKMV